MLWLSIYFLINLGFGCFYLLSKLFPNRAHFRCDYHEPSGALIEQCLPPEIFESIFSWLNCDELLTCRSVNKYWSYEASKDRVQVRVLNRQRDMNRKIFVDLISTDPVLNKPIDWLATKDYQLKYQVRDFQFATKQGKILLEMDANAILRFSRYKSRFTEEINESLSNFIVKTTSPVNGDGVAYYNIRRLMFAFKPKKLFKTQPNDQVFDLIFRFDEFLAIKRYDDDFILFHRLSEDLRYLAGLIPGNTDGLKILAFYLVPCIFHDFLHSNWCWGGYLSIFIWLISLGFNIGSLTRIQRSQWPSNILPAIIMTFCFTILPWLFYPWTLHFYFFVGHLMIFFMIYSGHEDFYRARIVDDRRFRIISASLLLLFILAMFPTPAYDKVMDGSIWPVIITNTICYIGACWFITWVNFVDLWMQRGEANLKMFFTWKPNIVWGIIRLTSFIFVMATYYPAVLK